MNRKSLTSLLLVLLTISFVSAETNQWTSLASNQQNISIAVDGPSTLDTANIAWISNEIPQGQSILRFESATGAILYNQRLYAVAKYLEPNELSWSGYDQTGSQLIAYDADSGQMLWNTIIDPALWDSWSTPSVDVKRNTILIASGNVTADNWFALPATIYAIDATTGAIAWSNQLDTGVLNATVCVADGLEHGRAFITDYDGFGTSGKLYCINLDDNTNENPYDPGQIIWSVVLGSTSGNTPVYKDGVVYVASSVYRSNGKLFAYDATADTPVIIWETTSPNYDNFMGGITLTKEGYLYAASYNLDETDVENDSHLYKLNSTDGSIVWITETEQTDSIPIVVGDNIYVSGGNNWSSRHKVSAYQDNGNSVVKLWETPPGMVIGGWTNQPVYADGKLYVGAVEDSGYYSYSELYILNVNLTPTHQEFIIAHHTDTICGNNPVVTYDSIYTLGNSAVVKFYQPALLADIDDDKTVGLADLSEFAGNWLYDRSIGTQRSDLNLDGVVNFIDLALLSEDWYKDIN